MTIIIDGTTGVPVSPVTGTLAVANGGSGVTTAIDYGFKNRIINGGMVIDQRNAGASVTPTVNPQYLVDRFSVENIVASKFAYQQNAGAVTSPVGFNNYLGATSQSAYSIGAGDYFLLQHKIEGFNIADLAWGTANAKTITLSFWVRSSLTGTFGGNLQNNAANRLYPYSYTISAANTWEQKTITIAGDTTGTWETTTSTGIMVRWSLGTGSTYLGTAGSWGSSVYLGVTGQTNVVGTNGATFYITGVQLEKGSTATSFDYRPYGTELALCQRYYYKLIGDTAGDFFGTGYNLNTTSSYLCMAFPVTMRDSPSALEQTGTASNYSISSAAGNTTCNTVPVFDGATSNTLRFSFYVASGLTAGQGCGARSNAVTSYLAVSAEL